VRFWLAGIIAVVACNKAPAADHRDGTSNTASGAVPSQPVQMPKVFVTGADGKELAVEVEVVRKPAELSRGLMYRRHLAPERGMLFIMPDESIQSFWMKNTYISLDIIFIGSDMTVAGIAENAQPQTLDHQMVDKPSRYVLEVNAGWSKKHGVGAGSKVRFDGVKL
jgi:uncharacterized membrane protein (UPF0127 family)